MRTPDARAWRRSGPRGRPRAWAMTSCSSVRRWRKSGARRTDRRWCAPPLRSPGPAVAAPGSRRGPGPGPDRALDRRRRRPPITACSVGGARRRRGDVDRLFEGGTVERVGLVEDGQDGELAVGEQSLDGHSGPGTNRSSEQGRGRGRRRRSAAMRRTRSTTAMASSVVSARSTPWLADNVVGLITQGRPIGSDQRGHLVGTGVGRPRGRRPVGAPRRRQPHRA